MKTLSYMLEIYEPGSESASNCIVSFTANTAFPKLSIGEYLNLVYLDMELKLSKIEHLIWENEGRVSLKTLIYTERIA